MKYILIVDDEERIRRIYFNLFKSDGFKAMEASNGQEAIVILKKRDFDLVLLDINLPDIDGKQVYDVIRDTQPNLKVIVASVYSLHEQTSRIAGAYDYYDKAQGIEVLLNKVREACKDEAKT